MILIFNAVKKFAGPLHCDALTLQGEAQPSFGLPLELSCQINLVRARDCSGMNVDISQRKLRRKLRRKTYH